MGLSHIGSNVCRATKRKLVRIAILGKRLGETAAIQSCNLHAASVAAEFGLVLLEKTDNMIFFFATESKVERNLSCRCDINGLRELECL